MAEALEVGSAYLQLMASGQGLQKQTDAAVKKVNAPDIIAKIDLQIGKLDKQAAAARKKLDELRAIKADPQIDLDIAAFQAKIAQSEEKLKDLRRQEASAKVTADITALEAQIGRANTSIQRLESKRSGPKITADIAEAEAKVRGFESQVSRLQRQRASVQVGAAGAERAAAQILGVGQAARRVDGSNAQVNVAAAGGAQASGILGAIVAGLAAVAAAAPAAAAGLATVLAAGSAAAQAGGAVAAGFSGIGDAIKAVEADEKSAATTSASAASSRKDSAGQIASAQSSLAQAVLQADRAAITGGQQVAQARTQAARTQVQGADSVADASRAYGRAVMQADRAAVSGAQQVQAARQAVADAVVSSAERTQAAERSVVRAQESARYAQESLTQARKDAAEQNRDLQLSLSGVAISEKRAALQLRKAIAARAGGGEVDPEQFKAEELDLDVAEASQNLAEVRDRFGDLRQQQADFARSGVDGSAQVVAAARAVREANLGAEDASRSLYQTQRDGSRQVADAVQASAQAQQQAAWSTADANDAVSDAALAQSRASRDAAWANQDAATQVQQAVQQSAWAQQDAARGVSDAQRGLQEALKATAESAGGAGAAGKKSAYELAKLTPAGRDFVDFWVNSWKPSMQDVTDGVAGEMLPRVQRSMLQLLGLQPELKTGLMGTGAVLGDLAVKGSDLATSPAFRASFVQIMASNNRALSSWGDAAISGADSARILTVAGLPLSERLGRAAEASSRGAESFLLQKESTGELARFMDYAADRGAQLVGVAVDLADTAIKVGMALEPVGSVVLDVVGGTIQLVGEFAQANQGLVQFIATAGIAVAGVNGLAKSIVAVQSSALIAGGGLATLGKIVSTGLNPAAIFGSVALTKMRDSAKAAAPMVATYASGLTGSISAGDKAGKATTGMANATSKLAAGLPGVTVGLVALYAIADAGSTSMDEAAAGFEKGGAAARETAKAIEETNQKPVVGENWFSDLNTWLKQQMGITTSVEEGRAALEKQRSEMSNLQAAQSRATEAQGNYEDKVRLFGPASKEATDALGELNIKTRDVEIAQIAVREKTDLATAALLYQRDQILAGLDADLRLRMSKQQLAKDEQALADAIAGTGVDSQAAKDAQLQLETTQLRTAEAAKSSAGGQKAYTDSIKEMVANTKGELTPTLAGMVGSLDAAGLAAIGATVKIDDTGRAVAVLPGGKTVALNATNAPALAGIEGVKLALGLVPPGKTVTVNTLDGPAIEKLRNLGFTVNTLPDGTVQVTANDEQARNRLIAFQAFAAWQVANPQLAADPARANEAMRKFLADAGAQTGVPALDADPKRADEEVRLAIDRYNRSNPTPVLDVDTKKADEKMSGWQSFWKRALGTLWPDDPPTESGRRGSGGDFKKDGGLIEGYASGGRLQHRQVFTGMDAGGRVRGPGGPTADRVPIMGSAGEYMIRARAVDAIGVPALDAINGMRDGGYLGHYAAGGGVRPQPGSPAPAAATAGAVPVPAGDPAAAAGAGAATEMLAGAMGVATAAAGGLQPALAAVTAQQQSMVSAGVSPLAAALTGQLVPAVMAGNAQVGVAAPLAHQTLQAAQAQTQLSTGLTAQNAAANNAGMAATTTGMSLAAQAQHAGLRAGQAATQASTTATAANTAVNSAAMAGAVTGSANVQQAQHSAVRVSQGQSVLANNVFAQNTQQRTADMSLANFGMSRSVQGHLGEVRGAQGVTSGATTAFADSWRAQLARTVPDSGIPIKWVINYPIRSITDAWNHLDGQFALGKQVRPYVPNFSTGGVADFATGGVMPGYTPGHDNRTIKVGGGEAIMRPEWTSVVGDGYVHAANRAARSGGQTGVREFLSNTGAAGGPAEGRMRQRLMARYPLDDSPTKVKGGWAQRFAYGGVAPHVAAAGDEVTRVVGRMPGGIGGRGSRGNASDHPFGFALDFMTMADQRLGDRVAMHLQQNAERMAVKYLIWKQAINQGRGWVPMENRGSATANHFDHVHASFEGGPLGGAWGDGPAGGAGFFDPTPIVEEAFKKAYAQIAEVPKLFGGSPQVGRDQGVAKASADAVKAKAIEKAMAMFAFSGGGNAEMFRPQVLQALAMLGLPANLADITIARMNKESSGNPAIVNNWDSNAKAGWPTKGLMQMRDDTFLSNWDPRTPRDIFNPLSNIVSSMRYAIGRYGSLPAAYNRPGGYANGGLLMPGQLGYNETRFPERVLDKVETRSYDTLTRLVGSNSPILDVPLPGDRGETHNHFFEGSTFRETIDLDQAMQRADFLAGTGSL